MLLLEVHTPGLSLVRTALFDSWRIDGLLHTLRSEFFDANVALLSFDEALAVLSAAMRQAHGLDDGGVPTAWKRQQEIATQLGLETGKDQYALPDDERERFREEVSRRYEREMRGDGLPLAFLKRKPSMLARSFVYALDTFSKALKVLSQESGAPANLPGLYDKLLATFPDLLGVRNTAHHMEDRARGLNRRGQPLALQPVLTPEVHAPNGALFLNMLIGTRYSCTMDDGRLGEVDVSEASLRSLHEVLEEVLRSFAWEGPGRTALS